MAGSASRLSMAGWLACACAMHLMPGLLISYQWLLRVFPLCASFRLCVYVCMYAFGTGVMISAILDKETKAICVTWTDYSRATRTDRGNLQHMSQNIKSHVPVRIVATGMNDSVPRRSPDDVRAGWYRSSYSFAVF